MMWRPSHVDEETNQQSDDGDQIEIPVGRNILVQIQKQLKGTLFGKGFLL